MKQLIYTIALMLVLVGSAAAQRGNNSTDPVLWQGTSQTFAGLSGIEVSPGTVDIVDDTRWGHTFTMGSDEGNLTVSLNYSSYQPNRDGGNIIVGGTWTMAVYKNGVYKGMLFGDVVGGLMEWKISKSSVITTGAVKAQLRTKGGTDDFKQITNVDVLGNLAATISYTEIALPKISGFADLMF